MDINLIVDRCHSLRFWCTGLVIALWMAAASFIFQHSFIQYSPDTFLYKELAHQPLTLAFLLHGERAPTLPVLLKLFKSEDAFVWFQLFFFYCAWLTLFGVLRKAIDNYAVYIVLVALLGALSVAQIFFSWHKLILTESVSLSGAVLLLALLCRFMIVAHFSRRAFAALLFIWIMWEYGRDANAYFSLCIAAGFLVICTIARFSENTNAKWRKGQLISAIMIGVGLMQLSAITDSGRWQFPLVDVIGLRILPSPERTQEFAAMGMPMNDKVACFRGKTAIDCNNDWTVFGDWLEKGKARTDYQNWLLRHFPSALMELFANWQTIWTSETILYGRSLESPISLYATKIALPKEDNFLRFAALSLAAFAMGLVVAARTGFRHWLSVLLLFYAANLPVAFVAYHGDALDIDRHTLNVQLNTYLTGWILILWGAAFAIEQIKTLCYRLSVHQA